MHTGVDLRVVGAGHRTHTIARALANGGLHSRTLSARQALQPPGAMVGAHIVVWCFPPWSHPMPEAEAYASGSIGLYAYWDDGSARIGPVTLLGTGPCPRCLAARASASLRGSHPMLGSWVAAWVALQCEALLRTETTELVGASWGWSFEAPNLALLTHRRDPACVLPGCGRC